MRVQISPQCARQILSIIEALITCDAEEIKVNEPKATWFRLCNEHWFGDWLYRSEPTDFTYEEIEEEEDHDYDHMFDLRIETKLVISRSKMIDAATARYVGRFSRDYKHVEIEAGFFCLLGCERNARSHQDASPDLVVLRELAELGNEPEPAFIGGAAQ